MFAKWSCLGLVGINALLLVVPPPLLAQQTFPPQLGTPAQTTSITGWQGEVTLMGANALLGGVTGGLSRILRGESFSRGFIVGLAGGALAYGGRRLSVLDFEGAGLIGRETAAVGASIVRNASTGRSAFARLMLPVGPVRLYLDRTIPGDARWHVKVNAYELYWMAHSLSEPSLDFQLEESLSAGAPVFLKTGQNIVMDGVELNGYQVGGVVVLSGLADVDHHRTLVHERVHVYQSDFIAHVWADPLEEWAMQRTAPTRFVHRFVDIGVTDALLRSGLDKLGCEYGNSAQEFEVRFLKTRH